MINTIVLNILNILENKISRKIRIMENTIYF